ncbi:MAG: DUF1844 domain-containing protein [Pseudomonadota bacterium]
MTEEKGFILKDKNHSSHPDASVENKDRNQASSEAKSGRRAGTPLPAIDFSTFMMSLNASALVSLGVIADPVSGATAKNLPIGKQTIDIISMLQEKTKGNLTPEEAKLITGMLYDLRITYVKQSG